MSDPKSQELLFDQEQLEGKFERKIHDSPYSEKIEYLLRNQDVGNYEKFLKDGLIDPRQANCFGTCIYVFGLEEVVENYVEGESKFDYSDMRSKKGSPSFISHRLMINFLLESGEMEKVKKEELEYGIAAFYQHPNSEEEPSESNLEDKGGIVVLSEGEKPLKHSAVYLGEFRDNDLLFGQEGIAGSYGFLTINERILDYDVEEVNFFRLNEENR